MTNRLLTVNISPAHPYLQSLNLPLGAQGSLSSCLWPSWILTALPQLPSSLASLTSVKGFACPVWTRCLLCELVFKELSSFWLCEDQLLWEMMTIYCACCILTSYGGKYTKDQMMEGNGILI